MQQVSVRGVDLQQLEARFHGAPGGLGEGLRHRADMVGAHCLGDRMTVLEGKGARRQEGPPSALVDLDGRVPLPRARGRCLSSRVRQLNARDGSLRADKRRDALQHVDLRVLPNS